jgi:dephospho-CoA kinase
VPFVVGLTGGIGSGKSTVADLFAALGAGIVDTDVIAHQLTGPDGAAMPAIRDRFGDTVIAPDGRLDRQAMRERAFTDPDARRALEAILHPLIRQEADRQVLASAAPYVMLVVPLLVESGTYRQRVDRVLVVDCAPETQVQRTMARSGLTRDDVLRILAAQATREARLAAADDVVDNDGPASRLPPFIAELHARYTAEAAARHHT